MSARLVAFVDGLGHRTVRWLAEYDYRFGQYNIRRTPTRWQFPGAEALDFAMALTEIPDNIRTFVPTGERDRFGLPIWRERSTAHQRVAIRYHVET